MNSRRLVFGLGAYVVAGAIWLATARPAQAAVDECNFAICTGTDYCGYSSWKYCSWQNNYCFTQACYKLEE